MAQTIKCKCGKKYQVKPDFVGTHIKCRNCDKRIPVARDEAEEIADIDCFVDEDEDQPDEFAAPIRHRKLRSRKRSSQWGFGGVQKWFGQVGHQILRIIMTGWGVITIVFSIAILRNLIISIPVCMLCVMGLAGVNGRGIAVSRDYQINGHQAVVVGSILIIVASILPMLILAVVAGAIGS